MRLIDDYTLGYIVEHENLCNMLLHFFGNIYQILNFKDVVIYNLLFSYIITKLQQKHYFSDNYVHLLNIILMDRLFGMDLISILQFYGIPFALHLVGHRFFENDNIIKPFEYQYKHVLFGYFRSIQLITGKIISENDFKKCIDSIDELCTKLL